MFRVKISGFTLIEVVITLLIMTVGLLGLAGLQATTVKIGLDNAKKSQITWLVTELVERIRANPEGQASGYEVTIEANNCPSAPNPRCSDNSQGDASTVCSPIQMARFDVWEVFCGQSESGIMANSSEALQLKSLAISCSGNCSGNTDFSVTIDWTSQAVSNSHILNEQARQARKTQAITMTVRP